LTWLSAPVFGNYNHVTMTHKAGLLRSARDLASVFLLLFCFLFALPTTAQSQGPPGLGPPPADTELEAQQKHAAEKAENTKRQQEIKRDTDKLLELASELKQYVDQSNEHTLSLAVIRKAEEIEKLAHTVRERMKGQ